MPILGNVLKFVKGTKGHLMPPLFFCFKSDFIPTLKLKHLNTGKQS